jgi:hypothetical protein
MRPCSPTFGRREARARGNPPWLVALVTLAHATRYRSLTRKILHDLDDERQLFFSLTTVKVDHGKPAMGRRLESFMTTAMATSGGASAPEMARAATVMAGGPPSGGSVLTSNHMGEVLYL